MEKEINPTASIINSDIGIIKAYRNVVIKDSEIKDYCSIGDDTTIERCQLEKNVIINRRSFINDSSIGMYTYTGINTTINWAKVGRFCSIARNVDIGGFNHDYKKITTMPAFRFNQIKKGGGKLTEIDKHNTYCEIGNDVWIAAGVQVLHKVKIGNGAVVGGGAVVTHDVPPYAIVAGIPAKIIGYRCNDKLIEELLRIKWWDWPESIILDSINDLLNYDITEEVLSDMKKISETVFYK